MKKYFFAMLTMAAALCGCSKDELLTNEVPQPGGGETNEVVEPMVFTATMEGAPETRATYDGTNKCASWEVDDRISINGFDYKANNAGTSTTFSKVASAAPPMEMRPAFESSTNTGSYQNQPAKNLVDADGVTTRWIADKSQRVAGAWNIVVSTGKAVYLKSIKLWNADNHDYPDRRWKTIKLYGSTSQDDEWEEISDPAPLTSSHPFANLNLAINNKGLAGEIAVNSTKAYTFYRIDVLDNEGDNYMQMSDMKFVVAESETLESPYTAYFPANLYDGSVASLPANYTETWEDGQFNMPMYAHSENTELHFKNLCGVLAIAVPSTQMSSVTSIVVTSDQQMNGAISSITDEGVLTFAPATLTDAEKKITLIASSAVTIDLGNSKTFYVPVPAGTHNPLKITVSDGTIEKVMATKKRGGVAVERNKIYPITFAENYPAGALPEEFTVADPDGVPNSGDEKKVLFSKGNLQATYNGTGYSWSFAENQYDYIGNAAGNTTIDSQSSGAIVDIFGWSTSANNYGICTSDRTQYYIGDFVDWGKNIGNGNTWRTLSFDEWSYLLNTRTVNGGSGAGKSYSLDITYGGKMGLVLYPDNYTGSVLSSTIGSLPEGVVFLPAAGFRTLSNVLLDGSRGWYWSSTPTNIGRAYNMQFSSSSVERLGEDIPRATANSVRLVTEVN